MKKWLVSIEHGKRCQAEAEVRNAKDVRGGWEGKTRETDVTRPTPSSLYTSDSKSRSGRARLSSREEGGGFSSEAGHSCTGTSG